MNADLSVKDEIKVHLHFREAKALDKGLERYARILSSSGVRLPITSHANREESTSGYNSRGWYTVPDNKKWHTVTWKITDAPFVSKCGCNFALEFAGNQFNKYYIQGVTVTKTDE